MCWSTLKKPVLKTAKRNISVKKVLTFNRNSPLYFFHWEKDKVYCTDMPIKPLLSPPISSLRSKYWKWTKQRKRWLIEDGFHSCKEVYKVYRNGFSYFSSQPRLEKFGFTISLLGTYVHVFDAVIPKGANYYLNESGEYVSDMLMIKGISQEPIETIKY